MAEAARPPELAGAKGTAPAALSDRVQHTGMRGYFLTRDILSRTWKDGYIHAGNIAYLSLVTLLPLIVLITAVTAAFGQTEAGQAAIATMLNALPKQVAALFEPVIQEVIEARTGNLLWIGGLVALWTVTTFVETLRDIIHRAFGVPLSRSFVAYRLRSIGGTLLAMLMMIIAFLSQVVLVVVVKSLALLVPGASDLPSWIDWPRLLPPFIIFLSLWGLFKLLAPRGQHHSPGWPGALITSIAWVGGMLLLGPSLSLAGEMSLTYGALSGVMLALLFFYAVGFALVLGAETNAALARAADKKAALAHAANSDAGLAHGPVAP